MSRRDENSTVRSADRTANRKDRPAISHGPLPPPNPSPGQKWRLGTIVLLETVWIVFLAVLALMS
jgi:hypothetical protein